MKGRVRDKSVKDGLLKKQPLLRGMTERHCGFKQPGEQGRPYDSLLIFRRPVERPGKTMWVIKSVIQRVGNSPKIAPAQELSQPDKYLQWCTEFIGPHEASLPNGRPPNETPHRRCRLWAGFNVSIHPMQGIALYGRSSFKVSAPTTELTVAVDCRGARFLIRGLRQDFEKLRRGGVVMLSVTEKLLQILLQQPVEITDPV
jgi:hypothetical protein